MQLQRGGKYIRAVRTAYVPIDLQLILPFMGNFFFLPWPLEVSSEVSINLLFVNVT